MGWNAVFDKWGNMVGIEPVIRNGKDKEKNMKEVELDNLEVGKWFGYKSRVGIKTGVAKKPNGFCGLNRLVEVYDVMDEMTYNFSNKFTVNTNWWEELAGNENIPNWILHKAFLEGAKIEWRAQGDTKWRYASSPIWGEGQAYRIKPTKKHTINIDGKEIELSEESYNNLKESLKAD